MRKPCTGSARLSVSSWKRFTPGEHAFTLMDPGEGSSRTADVSPDCATVREPPFRTVPISLRKEIGTVALHQLLDRLPGRSHEPPGRGANNGRPAHGGGPPVTFMASPGHVVPHFRLLGEKPLPSIPGGGWAGAGQPSFGQPRCDRWVEGSWRQEVDGPRPDRGGKCSIDGGDRAMPGRRRSLRPVIPLTPGHVSPPLKKNFVHIIPLWGI